jgi:hypothetical protein
VCEVLQATALFAFLTTGVAAASAVYGGVLALTPPPQRRLCAACELLTERHVALLAFAARLPATPETEKRRVEPGALRTAALAALKSFPGSAALLVMLTAAEARCSAWTRLRRALDLTLVDAPAPQRLAVWLQALRVEAQSTPGGVGAAAAHRVRGLLERAASASSSAASAAVSSTDADAAAAGATTPLVWRIYQAYEMAGGRPEAAKRVFFRAVNACPWSKALWLDGLRALRGVLPPAEMGELLDVMVDKGLRLRTDIFEALLEDAAADAPPDAAMCEEGS